MAQIPVLLSPGTLLSLFQSVCTASKKTSLDQSMKEERYGPGLMMALHNMGAVQVENCSHIELLWGTLKDNGEQKFSQ